MNKAYCHQESYKFFVFLRKKNRSLMSLMKILKIKWTDIDLCGMPLKIFIESPILIICIQFVR